jgi:NADPH:quinone reductase-like Zn-dependent oxidoreductase
MTVAPAAEQDSLVAAEPDRYYSLVITGLVEGPAALVSGAGSGIGRATARLLATHGARVAIVDINAPRRGANRRRRSPGRRSSHRPPGRWQQ